MKFKSEEIILIAYYTGIHFEVFLYKHAPFL